MTLLLRPSLLGSIFGKVGVRWGSNRSSICKINRSIYKRMYPVTLVHPDGSSIVIRYKEPRRIITLPLDFESLSPEEKKMQLQKRKPKRVIKDAEDFDDDFSLDRYRHLWNKR
ncbi:39S ribosomal protein L55, mitochondrial-like isoform X2 [Argonauta hians]